MKAVPLAEDDEPEPLSFAPRRMRRPSDAPPSSDRVSSDFAALSARFRSLSLPGFQGHRSSAHDDARKLITATADELRVRAFEARSPSEQARFNGFAESVDKLLESPVATEYLRKEGVSRDIVTYLRRYKAAQRVYGNVDDLRDVILKASVTAIHIAPCLGYWRANPSVPPEISKLLTAENVFGSVFRIAKERKPGWVDRLLGRYDAVTAALHGAPGKDGPIPVKARNRILWAWCKFNIRNVAYRLHRSLSTLAETEEAITDVKLVLVLFNVLLDDLADGLQDAELLQVFVDIPSAGGKFGIARAEAYAGLRARLAPLGWPQFEAYFDLAVDSWIAALQKLKEVVGAVYDELEPDLARDYEALLGAMRFSVDLNNHPREIFALDEATLNRRYQSGTFGDVLAHNANRAVFYTLDLMTLRAVDGDRYDEIAAAGAAAIYRENAWIFQDMQQIGNSVATGAREAESDDITNELFKIANDRLNTVANWPLPEHFASTPGAARRDAVITAFELKKAAKRALRSLPAGSPEQQAAQGEYAALAEDIEQMVELSGAEHAYFQHWLRRREEALDLFYRCDDWLDRYQLTTANDLLLVLHLMYKGRI